MDLAAATRSEWKYWPVRENATLRVQSGGIGTYADHSLTATGGAVKRRAITFKEMAASAGVYLNSDRAWLIPDENLPSGVKPKAGDIVLDSAGVSWTIGEVVVGKFGNTHKCIARALRLVNGLTATATVSRPAAGGKDSAGRPSLASATTIATVACRVQPEDYSAEESLDRVAMPRRYTAFLETPVDAKAHDQFVVGGTTYTVIAAHNPQRLWDLMSLDLELVP